MLFGPLSSSCRSGSPVCNFFPQGFGSLIDSSFSNRDSSVRSTCMPFCCCRQPPEMKPTKQNSKCLFPFSSLKSRIIALVLLANKDGDIDRHIGRCSAGSSDTAECSRTRTRSDDRWLLIRDRSKPGEVVAVRSSRVGILTHIRMVSVSTVREGLRTAANRHTLRVGRSTRIHTERVVMLVVRGAVRCSGERGTAPVSVHRGLKATRPMCVVRYRVIPSIVLMGIRSSHTAWHIK